MQTKPLRALLVVALLGLGKVVGSSDPADACSCSAPVDVEASVAGSEVVFIGTVLERADNATGGQEYSISVDQVVRDPGGGDAVEVWGNGYCGASYGAVGSEVAVFGRRDGDHIVGGGCGSGWTPADLHQLQPQPPPDGEGPIAALAAVSYHWANLLALDGHGRILASTRLPFNVTAVAPCPGGSVALVLGSAALGERVAAAVDLSNLTLTSPVRALGGSNGGDEVGCAVVEDAPMLLRAPSNVGGDFDPGRVRADRIDGTGMAGRRSVPFGASVIAPDGRVILLPTTRDLDLVVLDPATLDESARLDLGFTAVDAALDATGTTLAVLVADADASTYQLPGTRVLLIDVASPQPLVTGSFDVVDGPGWERSVGWIGPRIVVEAELDDGLDWDLVEPDGTIVSTGRRDWGGPLTTLGSGTAIRVVGYALEAIETDGSTTSSTIPQGFYYGQIAIVADGPASSGTVPEESQLLAPGVRADPRRPLDVDPFVSEDRQLLPVLLAGAGVAIGVAGLLLAHRRRRGALRA